MSWIDAGEVKPGMFVASPWGRRLAVRVTSIERDGRVVHLHGMQASDLGADKATVLHWPVDEPLLLYGVTR